MAEVANSENVEVAGVGDILLSLHEDDEGPRNIILSNVLYVPKLGGNLISIGSIEEKGFKVEFLNGEAKVTEETVPTSKRKGRLYIIEENKSSVYITRTENEKSWHRRMGHPHYNVVKKMDCTVSKSESSPTLNELCSTWIQGKMRDQSFPKVAST
ncbi:hypothetical protein AVEN_49006-1 [Araneus ventricosus]|uniref:GAG-pre-integrase domain-containing protein n=1 Tax=Araneus ventricosus TaxID=182803 RepID=A0A4Y2AGS3_ARAVE|nr:hypothetical protein AVEN_49006-1 [Araneus ventricosus]